jgi:Flp pilus assembly protein TadD
VWTLSDLPLSRAPQLDSLEYLLWAQRLAADASYWPSYPEHGPGYPLFLAVWLALFDGSLVAVRIVQAVLTAAGCVLTARIASRVWSRDAAVPAGLLQAVYAPLVYLDTAILAEPLLIFLLTLALDSATRAGTRAPRWLAAGVALGAAAIVRPTALIVAIAFAAVLLWQRRQGVVRTTTLTALAVGIVIVVGPVALQNWRVTGVPLVQAYGGMNFYLGNSPAGDGGARARPGGSWDALEGEASRAGATRNEQDRYFVRKTFSEIGGDPIGYVRVIGNKLLWLTQADELRDTHSFYFFRDAVPLLRWLPGYGILLPLAVVAAVFVRPAAAGRWVIAYMIAIAIGVVVLVVGYRYRAPLVPALCVFAGGSVVLLAGWIQRHQWRRAAMGAAIFGAIFIATHLRTDAATHNYAEEWAFTGLALLNEGRTADAESALRQATTLQPRSSFAWDGLGLVFHRQGRRDEARSAFQRAVDVNPMNALAWYHLGLVYDQQGDPVTATTLYRRSLTIAPERSDVLYALGSALLLQGQVGEAETLLRTVGARGNAHAYLGVAVIAMQRGDVRGAEAALANAQRLGADPARVQALHAAVTQLRLSTK